MTVAPTVVTKTGTVKNSFWASGRSAFVYWDGEDDGVGHSFPSDFIPDAEYGEGTRIRVTMELLVDVPAERNPFTVRDEERRREAALARASEQKEGAER